MALPIINVDTELGAKDLLNNRMAYVSVSRGAYDAQLFTDSREKLGAALAMMSRTQALIRPTRSRRSVSLQRHPSRRRARTWTLD